MRHMRVLSLSSRASSSTCLMTAHHHTHSSAPHESTSIMLILEAGLMQAR